MSNCGEKWVEIIEPTSREKMFANPATGEIVFAPPEGSVVKPMSNNQWWELFDQNSNSNYYYNVVTEETIWNKPGNDADIISLTKVQLSETELFKSDQESDQRQPVGSPTPPGAALAQVTEESNGVPGVKETDATVEEETNATPGVEETVTTPGVEESNTTSRVEETIATPGVEETIATPGVEETIATPGVEETNTTPGAEETNAVPRVDETFNETGINPKALRPASRKLSDMLTQEIEAMSPLKMDFPDSKFGLSRDTQTTEEPSAHAQATNSGLSSSAGGVLIRDQLHKLAGDKLRYQEHERGSWVNIKLIKDGRVSLDSGSISDHNWREENGEEEKKNVQCGSLDRTTRGRDQLSQSTGSDMKSRTLETRCSSRRTREPVRPAPGIPVKSPECKLKTTEAKLRTDSKLRTESKPRAASHYGLLSSSSSGQLLAHTGHLSAPIHVSSERNRASMIQPAPPPSAPSFVPPASKGTLTGIRSTVGSSLDKFEYLAKHRVGLFRKKVTIANMLSWTKDPIKQPMILTRDKQLKKEAIDLFKLLLQYMGDKRSKYKDTNLLGLEICRRAWEKKELRDEIYIQLCRQTTSNDHLKSLEKGWELISICLAFFPPSIRFRSYLEGYLWRNVDHRPEHKSVPVEVYAEYCHKKIEKMARSGAKKGLKKPNLEEVMHAKRAPFHPSMFGTSLEEVMEIQKEKFPDLQMPWVVEALVKAILELEGPTTEGIFRVPGDIDEVNGLKLQMDKGLLPMDTLKDPHVPASLLKFWFRELDDPLIPQAYYQECVSNCDDEVNAVSLVESLPDFNRELLIYLIRFLKEFVTVDRISHTKMGLENIAMVWAPNFLRCPSEDHALIFENTRKEMAFLRLLLKFLETDDTDD